MNTFAISAENAAIIEALKGNGGHFVDDHTGRVTNTKVVVVCTTYVAESGDVVDQKVCGAYNATPFSTNPLEIKEEAVHLSVWSHGPNVTMKADEDLEHAVERINAKPVLFGNPWHLQVVRF